MKDKNRHRERQLRVNRQIRAPKVRLIDENGQQIGIVPTRQALAIAEEKGLDLVEVSPNADPPVCKIMDFGKYKYELKKKQKEAKKRQHQMQIKELKLSPKIDQHDLEIKMKHARRFLEDGNGVKFSMRFKGRELIYADEGAKTLLKVAQELSDLGQIQKKPVLEGNNLTMIMIPKK